MELPIVKKLKQEVDELRYELQVKIPKDLQEAAAQGDLSENAEYETARARQDLVRARVAQLEERLRQLVLYDFSSIPRDRIAYGSRVTLEDASDGKVVEYQIVFPEEVDPNAGHVSLSSPIGQALLRKEVGDEVEVTTPQGKCKYEIIQLLTLHDLMANNGGR
ncbi:MAG: transcription elongation factor GreA [Deltaproteobacteria bacterium]|nr:transcription elongation factor GreA [Deltaproteobacteria bacterium]